MRLFASGLRKLVRRPATWVTFLLLDTLVVLIFLAVGATLRQIEDAEAEAASRLLLTFPGAYAFVLAFVLGLGTLFAVIYGAAIAGSEWSWGTLKNAVARGESRTRYIGGQYASVLVMVMAGLVAAFAVGVLAAILGAVLAGLPLDGLDDMPTLGELPEQVVRGWIALAMSAAFGFAIATIAKSQLAGIGVGIGLYFGEQLSGLFLPDIVKYLPFAAASSVISAGGGGGMGGAQAPALPPDAALAVTLAWLVGSLVVAALVTERAEIGG